MGHIQISHSHSCDHKEEACERAENMLEEIAQDYGLEIFHDGDGNFEFTGSGISGHVSIDQDKIDLKATLGFLMLAMKSVIEAGIQKKLDKNF
jgi:putative polyhydroxyalkanoate system protein